MEVQTPGRRDDRSLCRDRRLRDCRHSCSRRVAPGEELERRLHRHDRRQQLHERRRVHDRHEHRSVLCGFHLPVSRQLSVVGCSEPLLPRHSAITTGKRPALLPYLNYFTLPGNERYYELHPIAGARLRRRQRFTRTRRHLPVVDPGAVAAGETRGVDARLSIRGDASRAVLVRTERLARGGAMAVSRVGRVGGAGRDTITPTSGSSATA